MLNDKYAKRNFPISNYDDSIRACTTAYRPCTCIFVKHMRVTFAYNIFIIACIYETRQQLLLMPLCILAWWWAYCSKSTRNLTASCYRIVLACAKQRQLIFIAIHVKYSLLDAWPGYANDLCLCTRLHFGFTECRTSTSRLVTSTPYNYLTNQCKKGLAQQISS